MSFQAGYVVCHLPSSYVFVEVDEDEDEGVRKTVLKVVGIQVVLVAMGAGVVVDGSGLLPVPRRVVARTAVLVVSENGSDAVVVWLELGTDQGFVGIGAGGVAEGIEGIVSVGDVGVTTMDVVELMGDMGVAAVELA